MSGSDSDYSIDWLASDEDDHSGPKRSSPQRPEEPLVAATPSSPTSSLREPPTSCLHCGAAQRRRTRRTRRRRRRSHSAGRDGLCAKPRADAEREILSQKWPELQCYIRPLSSILRGLRSGRYSERLSRFQESVAKDRLQRIMGVLQNPHMGRRFLGLILTIEKMLQRWFPQVQPRLSPTDDGPPTKRQKHPSGAASSSSSSAPPPSSLASLCSSGVEMYASIQLKCLRPSRLSPIRSQKTPGSTLDQRGASTSPLVVIQDNTVSSSTDRRAFPRRRVAGDPGGLTRGPPPFKISSPCLEGLLHAKQSVVTPRSGGGGACR